MAAKKEKEIIEKPKVAAKTGKNDEIQFMDIELTLHRHLKYCYTDLADSVRAKGFKEKKFNCKVNLRLIVNKGLDYKEGQDVFLRIIGNYFNKGTNLTIEVK